MGTKLQMTDETDNDRQESGNVQEKFSEERVRRRLPDGLTDRQREVLTLVIRNPNAREYEISRHIGADGATVRNAVQSYVRGSYRHDAGAGAAQAVELRDKPRMAEEYAELTDKQRAVVDFVAENYGWVHDDDTTAGNVSDAIKDEHDVEVHPTYWPDVTSRYSDILDIRRQEVEAAEETPDVESLSWFELIDAIPDEKPDRNLDDLEPADEEREPEDAKRKEFAANSAEATDSTDDNDMATSKPDSDVALEIDETDEQQIDEGTSINVPDVVRDESADPFDRADALVDDLNERIAFVEDLDEPGKAALRFQDYFQVTRSVVGALEERLDESESVTRNLRNRAQKAEGKQGELERVINTQEERIDELNDHVMAAEERIGELEQELMDAADPSALEDAKQERDAARDVVEELRAKLENAKADDGPTVPLADIGDEELRTVLLMIAQFDDTRNLEGYEIDNDDYVGATVKIDFGPKDDDQ